MNYHSLVLLRLGYLMSSYLVVPVQAMSWEGIMLFTGRVGVVAAGIEVSCVSFELVLPYIVLLQHCG